MGLVVGLGEPGVKVEIVAETDEYRQQKHWAINWFLPAIPLFKIRPEMWLNTEHWDTSRAEDHFG